MDLYHFDFDKTLYAYDSHFRLPSLSLVTGVSQYHLAKTWWAGGYGARAEDSFFVDDSAENVEGARAVGIHAHQLVYLDGVPQTAALDQAISRFAGRNT